MLRAYLRLAVFAVGLLAGVQVPGFVDQYAKRVQAHYLEVSHNFVGFQRTADQYFGGNVEALIAHHTASEDAVFRDEAKTISTIYARLKLLTAELQALNGNFFGRIAHVALRPNHEMLDETAAVYSYTVPLNESAVLSGVTAGLLLALIVESLLIGGAWLLQLGFSRIVRPRSPVHVARAPHRTH